MARKRKQQNVAQADGAVAVLDETPEEVAEVAPVRPDLLEGLIVDGSRGIYRVETADGPFSCTIRGKLRKQLVYAESGTPRRGGASSR